MLDDSMDKIRSVAALAGFLGGSVDSVMDRARATVELDYLERSRALRAEIASLEARANRLGERDLRIRERLNMLMAERSLSAPFDWILAKVQLAFLARRTKRLEAMLDSAQNDLYLLREWASARTKELESRIQIAYDQGTSLREVTGQIGPLPKEGWDVLQ